MDQEASQKGVNMTDNPRLSAALEWSAKRSKELGHDKKPLKLKPCKVHIGAQCTDTLKAALIKTQSIYVIQCNEFIKVGIASEVPQRLRDMQVGNPYQLVVVGHWKTNHPHRDEQAIHAFLDKFHERGEWFKLPKSMLDLITMKLPGYELAQRIMEPAKFASMRDELWQLNSYSYRPF